jgi:hypothetical protein
MDLSVTVGMQQHSILGPVRSSTRTRDDVVVVPPRRGCDELAAHPAASLLVAPEVKRLPTAPELGRHLSTQTGGKVVLPGRIIGIGLPSDFRMPPNWRCGHFHQAVFAGRAPVGPPALEHPLVVTDGSEVALADPAPAFVRMTPRGPSPPGVEDRMVDVREGPFAHHVTVILGPPPEQGVELPDQLPGRGLPVVLDNCPDLF